MGWPKISMPKIRIDGGTLKNVIKNFTPVGVAAGAAQAAGLTNRNLIDQASDLISGNRGGGGGGGGPGDTGIGDVSKKYASALEEQRLKNLEVGNELTSQLRQQAMGEGPLANAQLKSAQNRNLAQTLAAAQTAGGSPLAIRQMLQQRGQQGQELAQLGIQERLGAQQALGQQLASQAGIGRSDIMAGFDISKMPATFSHEAAMQQASLQAQKDMALKQQQSAILGSLIQAGASAGAAAMSDKNQKEAPNSDKQPLGNRQKQKLPDAVAEVNEMMDKLEPKKYKYKDASLPGTAPGTRYGIIAQDLEKSSLGKTLVKDTQHGKMIDTVQGFGAVLAAQAELNRRLKKVEKKGK